jgi:S-methylmethionine-dependent homocysteine/selenocysteine methylase
MTRLLDGDLDTVLGGRDLARTLLDDPAAITAAHRAFLAAGAKVLRLPTATLFRRRLIRAGIGEHWAEANLSAVAAAEVAREAAGDALLAATLGPFRRSGFRDEVPDLATLEPEYAEQAALLAPGVDIVLAEGMSTVREAIAAATAGAATGRPVWVDFAVHPADGTRLTRGERLVDAVVAVEPFVTAMLASGPGERAAQALDLLAAHGTAGAIVAGAAETAAPWDPSKGAADVIVRRTLTEAELSAAAARVLDAGATIVGGGPGVGPDALRRIARLAREAGA